MSEISLNNRNSASGLPPVVRQLLSGLRARLRTYGVVSGLLLVVSLAAAVFWLTTGLDSGWFAIQKLELPIPVRLLLAAVLLPAAAWVVIRALLFPLLRRLRDLDLALLLERRFPQYQDRLITTVEGVPHSPQQEPLLSGMLQRTVNQAAEISRQIELAEVFDLQSLKRRGLVAVLLAGSVLIFGLISPGSLQRWWNAFVAIEPVYHQRTTDVDVTVIAQPGDRRLKFRTAATAAGAPGNWTEQPTYRHPRGNDLELELTIPEGNSADGSAWVVPERIRVDVLRPDGSRSRTFVSATSDRTFRFILTRLQESIELELLAGDYRSPEPYAVQVVTPPGIDQITLDCDYPEYTGWNQIRERQIDVLGSEVSLPIGTEFLLSAISNKPLQSGRLVTDWFELSGDSSGCRLLPRNDYPVELAGTEPLLSEDGRRITARLRIIDPDLQAAERADSDQQPQTVDAGLPISPSTSLRFWLHDQDDTISASPESLRIRGISDEPPVIATRIAGVDNAITRLAVIPVTGSITDDYGLVTAGFEFVVDAATEWRPRPFSQAPRSGTTKFELGAASDSGTETFAVQPLDLTEGQTLSLAIVAKDGRTVGHPNVTRGEPVLFRIVSNEELLSLLYTREVALRRRFEEVLHQLELVRDDLVFHQDVATRLDNAAAEDIKSEDRIGLTTAATRSGNNLRRQNNELQSIAEGFEQIVQQLINNAIPPRQLSEQMRSDIVTPLNDISTTLLVDADKAVSRFRVAALAGKPAAESVSESIQAVNAVIVRLQQILENVRDMAEFHEALRDLKAILEEQQRVLDETKRLRNRGFFDDL